MPKNIPGLGERRGAFRLTLTLIGDGIENLSNAVTLTHAAQMFGYRCVFKDWVHLAEAWPAEPGSQDLAMVSASQITSEYDPIVVVDTDGTDDVYGFRPPRSENPALVVGNERRGISREIRSEAKFSIRIPTSSRMVSSLNVAAAGAVALFYINKRGRGPVRRRSRPETRRPSVLMVGVSEHIELGSAIRSAAAFGWQTLLVEDRANAWFGSDRGTRSEGRAAARRGRNPIRVIPSRTGAAHAFDLATVVTTTRGIPIDRVRLAGGRGQVVVLPDERAVELETEDWARLARSVEFVNISLPVPAFHYHFRLIASIALAEVARQVGLPMSSPEQVIVRRRPRYHTTLSMEPDERGEAVSVDELLCF